jgi:hypothetical protein
MATVANLPGQGSTQFNVLGTRPIRHDGVDKVTGRAQYGADVQLAGLLHGKVLRSPHPHARIRRLDATKALSLHGVRAVVTSADFPVIAETTIDFGEMKGNSRLLAAIVMAADKVLFKGHAVAAVAADSPHVAEEALGLIEVEYEVLDPVLDMLEAMLPEYCAPYLKWNNPEGGFFLWLEYSEEIDTEKFRVKILEKGIRARPGELFYAGHEGSRNFRAAFTRPPEEEIERGMELMGQALVESLK